jgi:colicin import membrane protein
MKDAVRLIISALIAAPLSTSIATADEMTDLIAFFKERFKACYTLPWETRGQGTIVVVEVRLNADGTLAQAPRVLRGQTGSAHAKAAIRAVERCAPLRIPAEFMPRHSQWKVMQIAFEAL